MQLGDQYYSADNVPAGTVVINLGNYGVESDQTVTDLYQWRKNWSNDLNASATYKETTVNGHKALEERTAKDVTVYISTGTSRVLAFTFFPLNSTNEKLFNSILGTITITK